MRTFTHLLWCVAFCLVSVSSAAEGSRRPSSVRGARAKVERPPQPKPPTPVQRLHRAEQRLAAMGRRSHTTQRWLRYARGRRDWAKAQCLDRNLSQLHAAERMAVAEHRRMQQSLALGRDIRHHAVRITTFHARSRALFIRAGGCGRTKLRNWPTTTRVTAIKPRLPPPVRWR